MGNVQGTSVTKFCKHLRAILEIKYGTMLENRHGTVLEIKYKQELLQVKIK